MKLFIYLVTRTDSGGYDSWDSFVVVASSEDAARHTYPDRYHRWDDRKWDRKLHAGWVDLYADGSSEPIHKGHGWTDNPETLTVTRVGIADPAALRTSECQVLEGDPVQASLGGAVICASFNAG